MDIMVSLHTAEFLEQLKNFDVTHVMVNDESFSSGSTGLSLPQLKEMVEKIHTYGFKAVVKVDRLYDQSEIEELKSYLRFVDECHGDMVLFSDITIKVLVEKLGLQLECIYAPETLLTNQYDVQQLKEDNFSGCVISKDIPLTDVYDIAQFNPGYCFIRAHGPILISYSKRRFISVYLNDYKEYRDSYYLKEENREVKLPIIEKEKGCWVYGYTLESFEEISNIAGKPFRGIIVDNILSDDQYTLKCVELYNAVLKGAMDSSTALERLKELDQNIEYTSINDIKKTFLEKE